MASTITRKAGAQRRVIKKMDFIYALANELNLQSIEEARELYDSVERVAHDLFTIFGEVPLFNLVTLRMKDSAPRNYRDLKDKKIKISEGKRVPVANPTKKARELALLNLEQENE